MWRKVRIAVLLTILVIVAVGTWLDQSRTTSWEYTLRVGAFPINADGSPVTAAFIDRLDEAQLKPVSEFIAREAHRYGVALDTPIEIRVYPQPTTAPPAFVPDAGPVSRIIWSLRLRRYRSQVVNGIERARPSIALFLLYHDPTLATSLPHSLGLQRGLTGVVQLFASRSQSGQNAIVTAHELLHTFGATDKYDPKTDVPLYPAGFAEPLREPRYPQRYAEIMAGRVPLSPGQQEMPEDLSQAMVGPATAREIGWRH